MISGQQLFIETPWPYWKFQKCLLLFSNKPFIFIAWDNPQQLNPPRLFQCMQTRAQLLLLQRRCLAAFALLTRC
jgi:hypothetical protein